MKKYLLLLYFSLIAASSNAQQRGYDTIPYALDYHKKRLDSFNNEPMTKGGILFLGNSITEFGDWKSLLNDSTVINRGIAGDITFGVLKRLDDVIARQPSKLFLKIGINDIAKNIPDSVIAENIYRIVRTIKTGSLKTQIFVHSILPTNDAVKAEYPDIFHKNDHVIAVNARLQQNAKKVGFMFIDVYKIFKDKNGNLERKYAEKDGLHLNPAGYKLWVGVLLKGTYLNSDGSHLEHRNK